MCNSSDVDKVIERQTHSDGRDVWERFHLNVLISEINRSQSNLDYGEGVGLNLGVLMCLVNDNLVPCLTLRANSRTGADIRQREIKIVLALLVINVVLEDVVQLLPNSQN